MIRTNIGENFPIVVSLLDEDTGQLVSGKTVYYDVRYINDTLLTPPVSGTLVESTVQSGLYKKVININVPGLFICYATCSGYVTNTEEIVIDEYNIYDITRSNRHYNISVEDFIRENATPTASQTARNVPLGRTDYIITKIKSDDAIDWSSPVSSGTVWAHYVSDTETTPYRMGGEY